jgi:hypothetical protein
MLTLKIYDPDHKTKTNPIEGKKKKAKFSIKKY